MPEDHKRARRDTSALVIGYAMSRLDEGYLSERGLESWADAYREAEQALSHPAATFNNLRDEFDPYNPNPRKGWHQRTLRPDRQRILDELTETSDDALLALVERILARDEDAAAEAIDALAVTNRVAHNVAERLLTGRRAEEYFLAHVRQIVGVGTDALIDLRNAACGYDFGIRDAPEQAIEIKGLKQTRGPIQFTDREWFEAKRRRDDYRLVVVGNIDVQPLPRVFPNPYETIAAECRHQTVVTAVWRSTVSVSP